MPPRRALVVNVVGLTPGLIGPHTPAIAAVARRGGVAAVTPSLPAVTASVQATYLTGTPPHAHGVVGNGWYDRENAEVRFWRQADALVQRPRIWDVLRRHDPAATTANSFWWNAMYTSADVTVTPRPMYPADGRKLPDVWTNPPALRDELQERLGQFPLFMFWGPLTGIESTRWITSAALEIERRFRPTLHLVYLPHLDYVLQRDGPPNASWCGHPAHALVPGKLERGQDAHTTAIERDLRDVDAEVARLTAMADANGLAVLLLSEYGITPVVTPVHLNRALRDQGHLTLRDELGRELLDSGASRAFAVADHQLAHVYVRDAADIAAVRRVVDATPGVARTYAGDERAAIGLDHPAAARSSPSPRRAPGSPTTTGKTTTAPPDFARTVDIHRKPGYDPAELFLDPARPLVKARIAAKLLARKLGLRNLLDVIPLDATLVRGSHGLLPADPRDAPVLVSSEPGLLDRATYDATEVMDLILRHTGLNPSPGISGQG